MHTDGSSDNWGLDATLSPAGLLGPGTLSIDAGLAAAGPERAFRLHGHSQKPAGPPQDKRPGLCGLEGLWPVKCQGGEGRGGGRAWGGSQSRPRPLAVSPCDTKNLAVRLPSAAVVQCHPMPPSFLHWWLLVLRCCYAIKVIPKKKDYHTVSTNH